MIIPKGLFYPALLLLLVTGCAQNTDGTWKAPFIYRIDVQQGNVVDQEMIDKLKPGMDKNQVKFILGSPLITDPFHSNRWDYVYSFEPGRGERQQRRITVYFKENKLSRVEGNIQTTERSLTEENLPKERSVDVPLERYEEGFFSKMFDRDGEDEAEPASTGSTTDTAAESLAEDEETTETETAGTSETSADESTVTESAATGAAPPESGTADETTADQAGPSGSTESLETETAEAEDESSSEKTTQDSTRESEQDKNLVRRFWDRMTSGKEESGVESGEETERDLRDAEVFEDAGGDL